MLIQVHRIDENGFYLEPVLIEQGDVVNDENIITVDPPQGLYKPRWVEGEWTEGLSQQEIDELTKPKPLTPSDTDVLGQQLAEKELQIIRLQQENKILGQQVAEKELRIAKLESDTAIQGKLLAALDLKISQMEGTE